jgi:PucR C-terminal helix-turn-helix domain/GGDEF-like domain
MYVSLMAELTADAQLSCVAHKVGSQATEVGQDITKYLLAAIPELQVDELVAELLGASVDANVSTLLHVLEHRIRLDSVDAPAEAAEYGRRLSQRGIPLIALVRAYRLGHGRLLRWCLEELGRQVRDARMMSAVTGLMMEVSFTYIDRVAEQVIAAYQEERDRWLITQTAFRARRVTALLADERISADSIEPDLGYRLRRHHLGLLAWVPEPTQGGAGLLRLDRMVTTVGRELDCPGTPLFVPCDEASCWAWLPIGDGAAKGAALRESVAAADPTIRVAAGDRGHGVVGFRRTHRQAQQAQDVALAARPGARVTLFAEVGPVAFLCADIAATRSWVWTVLGELAADDDHNANLRQTLRVFLACGASYTATADRLTLHRNTVQYRIRKAEEALGQPTQQDRANVELALKACLHLGATVLRPIGVNS